MQIMLLLLLLAAIAILALAGAFFGSLLVGTILLHLPKAKPLVPIFLLIIPSTVLGGLAGGVGGGYLAVQYDDQLVLLGPLAGVLIGAAMGFLVGAACAVVWRRRKRTTR